MKTGLIKNTVSFLVLAAGISSGVFAQNISDALRLAVPGSGFNARALGMGNAYIGLSDDASASYYNPAGLGLIRKMEFTGGLNYNKINNSSTFLNNKTEYSNSTTNLDQISFAFPFPTLRGSLVLGLSYNTTKDFSGALKFDGFNSQSESAVQYILDRYDRYDLGLSSATDVTNIHGNLNQSGNVLESGKLENYTFSGALEINKDLFVGANLNIISGSYDHVGEYYEDDTEGKYLRTRADPTDSTTLGLRTLAINQKLNWDISGWDLKVGILYQFRDIARFGFTIQFPKTYGVKEEYKFNAGTQFEKKAYQLDEQTTKVEYDVVSPYTFSGGTAINYMGFILSLEGSFTDYTQMKFDNPSAVEGVKSANFEDKINSMNKDIKSSLQSVFSYNMGLEYTFYDLGLRLRAGYFVQPSAYKGDASDYDRKYVTAGFGFLLEDAIAIDFAYAHGFWKDLGDNYSSGLSRTYQDLKNDKVIVTGTFRF